MAFGKHTKRCLVKARGILDAIGEAAGRHPKPRPQAQAGLLPKTARPLPLAAPRRTPRPGLGCQSRWRKCRSGWQLAGRPPDSELPRDSPESDPPGPSGRGRIQPDMQRLSFDDDRAPKIGPKPVVDSESRTRRTRTILLKTRSGPTTNPNTGRPRILAAAPSRPPFPVHLFGSCTRGAFDPATLPSQPERHAAC